MKSPIVLLSSLLKAFQRLEPDVKGLSMDLRTIERRVKDEGNGFLTIALPALGHALDKALSSGIFVMPMGFKKAPKRAIPQLFEGMFNEVFDEFGYVLKNPNYGVIRQLRDVLYLFKKAALSEESNEELDFKAKRVFFDTDEAIARHVTPSNVIDQLKRVSAFILSDLLSKDFGEVWCKHGPGSVSEGLHSNQKWEEVYTAIREDDNNYAKYGFDLFQTAVLMHEEVFQLRTKVPPELVESDLNVESSNSPISGIAKLITVAKNSTSRRTITIEPGRRMFLQQGLNTMLRDSITRCKVLNRCLALTDQSLNQILALKGSQTNEWATIDLKSASDLLSQGLVEEVFRYHPAFLGELMANRSSHVSVAKNKARKLEKFAGMGNATTFPVQSICFAVVCIAGILNLWGKRPTMDACKQAADMLQVYGDDIIVREEYASQVVLWLQHVGLKVNISKSFLEGNFKESCGVDAYMGVDVTPLYVKHLPEKDTELTSDAIAAYVALSNSSWERAYYEFSACLVDMCERSLGKRIPLVSRYSGAIGLHSRQDASAVQKWNAKLHRFEVRTFVQVSPTRKDPVDGYAALLKFFHTSLLGRPKGHLSKTEVRFKSRIVLRWVPAQAG